MFTLLFQPKNFVEKDFVQYEHIQGVPKKVGINDLVWFIMIWLIQIVLYGLGVNPGNSHQS